MDQLDAIAERIMDIDPLISFKRLIFNNPATRSLEVFRQGGDIIDQKGRMGLKSRAKICLDTEMHLHRTGLEPAAATFGQIGRLLPFEKAEQTGIESTGLIFAARWHGELDMIKTQQRHLSAVVCGAQTIFRLLRQHLTYLGH